VSQFIDRRPNGKHKSAVNRRRFLKRVSNQVRKAVSKAISDRSITDINQGETINIPTKDIIEPTFHHGDGGERDIILPGNKHFSPGDRIKRPPKSGGGSGSQASNSGEGDDDFAFHISQEEFLEIFFEDLQLPNLVQKELTRIKTSKQTRAGFTSEGNPSNINILRSMKNAHARKFALGATIRKKIKAKKKELEELEELFKIEDKDKDKDKDKDNDYTDKIELLEEELATLKKKVNRIPFIDPFDISYHNRIITETPSTQAVMFCLMDVSGSMDEAKKDIAKRFFILLYLFLQRAYEKIDIVFIRHHTSAKEVSEHDFFYSRETGGTVVSSALEMMSDVMKKKYPPSEWNIYAAQASDGDNWNNDSPKCGSLLESAILPFVQYYAYVEIMPRHHQSLWETYLSLKDKFPEFSMQNISTQKEIYPVFRELFKKKVS